MGQITNTIDAKIERFKEDLAALSVPLMVQKHVTYGSCHVLSDDQYFDLKARVSLFFGIHPSEVLVVGSGKLGFSIAPTKRYRPFSDQSDIDVALVSSSLFDECWMDVFLFKAERNYWPKEADFSSYLVKGWIRPDMLPPARRFEKARRWWTFFGQLSKDLKTSFRVRAGLYRSWAFLERYQSICVQQCLSEAQ